MQNNNFMNKNLGPLKNNLEELLSNPINSISYEFYIFFKNFLMDFVFVGFRFKLFFFFFSIFGIRGNYPLLHRGDFFKDFFILQNRLDFILFFSSMDNYG